MKFNENSRIFLKLHLKLQLKCTNVMGFWTRIKVYVYEWGPFAIASAREKKKRTSFMDENECIHCIHKCAAISILRKYYIRK